MISRLRLFSLTKAYFSRSRKAFKVPSFGDEVEEGIEEQQVQTSPKQMDPASVIKKFRRDVLSKSIFTKEEQEITKHIEQYDKDLKQTLKKGSKDEQLANTRRLVEKFVNDKSIFGNLTKDPLLSNYGNYSAYQSATIKEEKIRGQSWEGQGVTKGYRFLRSLGPDYLENQLIDKHLVESYEGKLSVEQYAKHMQKALNDGNRLVEQANTLPINPLNNDFYNNPENAKYQETAMEKQDLEQYSSIFDENGEQQIAFYNGANNYGRLSPIACEEIYKCHLDGWCVRDISQRFGIHPRRTKFIIWARATYYTQVLPRLGFKHFKDIMLMELEYANKAGFIDYGLDLETIKEEASGKVQRVRAWNNKMVDIKADTHIEVERKRQRAIEILQEHGEATPKHQKVLLGYFGKNNKLTEMRDWKIHRAKGSDYQHAKYNTFRKLFKKTGRETYK